MIASRTSAVALLLVSAFAVAGRLGAVGIGLAAAWIVYTIILMVAAEWRWRRHITEGDTMGDAREARWYMPTLPMAPDVTEELAAVDLDVVFGDRFTDAMDTVVLKRQH